MARNKTICLSMIVKNESLCIKKCLDSLKDHIDYWIICDTGSTDNTIDVIKDVMKDIPGEVHQHEWEDFATNRNKGIELAKNKADYTLIIDADDSLVFENQDAFNNLSADAYRLKIKHGNLEYYRPQLISNSISYKYVSVLHEYIELPECNYEALDGVYMQTSFNGARGKNPNKYLDDAKLLEKALEKEPNNSRYVFYLAQSYRDCGQDEKAIIYYEKRADMGGWIEEVYVSLLEAAKAKERLSKSIYEIESAYLKAYYAHPTRAESLYQLSLFFRLKNLFNKGFFYAQEALSIPKPSEGLFIDSQCYQWKILDEIAVNAYYSNHINDGIKACKQLLKNNNFPESQTNRIKNNFNFLIQKSIENLK